MIRFDKYKRYFLLKGTEIIAEGTGIEICEETGRKMNSLQSMFRRTYKYSSSYETSYSHKNRAYLSIIREEDLPIFLDKPELEPKKFALYKGDKFIAQGTTEEIAKETGISKSTVIYYGTNRHKSSNKGNRRILIQSDEQ